MTENPLLENSILNFLNSLKVKNIEVHATLEEMAAFLSNTVGATREVLSIVFPKTEQEVVEIIHAANKYKILLYPVSTGNNWGYGGQLPIKTRSVIVNLSKLKQIIEVNDDLGFVRLTPGVTQQMLHEYLVKHDLDFMVPTTGAGPHCSILGNALERGYGITPIADHFESILSLKAILPNGEKYHSALVDFAGELVDNCYKWGIGPYLDGLFSQGNFGIVTEMTVALKRRPKKVEAFFFNLKDEGALLNFIPTLAKLRDELGPTIGGVNLMNARRVLSMLEQEKASDALFTKDEIRALSKKHGVGEWNCVGALYGTQAMVKNAKDIIKKELKKTTKRILFFDKNKTSKINKLFNQFSCLNNLFPLLAVKVDRLNKLMDALAGQPSQVALPLVYWKCAHLMPANSDKINPDQDGAGLIWYSPLVPKKKDIVLSFIKMLESHCLKKNIEPLITLTSLSSRCFDATVPILFDKSDLTSKENALQLYKNILKNGQEIGIAPYRLGVNSMDSLTNLSCPSIDLAAQIKLAIDPNGIISPGRYVKIK